MKSSNELLHEAHVIRGELIRQHPTELTGLSEIQFRISRALVRTAGHARFRTKLVTLSLPFFACEANFKMAFRNTVTHEIAHILSPSFRIQGYRAKPHGPEWQALHISFGGDGKRCHALQLAEAFQTRRRTLHDIPCSKCRQTIQVGPRQYKRHLEWQKLGLLGYRHKSGICP